MSIQVFGLPVSRGVAIGRAVLVASSRVDVAHYYVEARLIEAEVRRLGAARDLVVEELTALKGDVPEDAHDELVALLDVHAASPSVGTAYRQGEERLLFAVDDGTRLDGVHQESRRPLDPVAHRYPAERLSQRERLCHRRIHLTGVNHVERNRLGHLRILRFKIRNLVAIVCCRNNLAASLQDFFSEQPAETGRGSGDEPDFGCVRFACRISRRISHRYLTP